jgi:hypothetical protein
MKKVDCTHRNHRHGIFCNFSSSRNFRTHDIPYYSIFGIHGMSKILQTGCSKIYSGRCVFFGTKSRVLKFFLHGKASKKTEFATA